MPERNTGLSGGLTPADSDSTRQRIVSAAVSVLATRGSQETSIKEVARAAGVAPGLVHYYFSNKSELFVEAVRETCRAFRDQMAALTLPNDAIARTRALLAWCKRRALEEPNWYRLIVGLDALAVRDPALAKEVASLKAEARDMVAQLVRATEAEIGKPLGPTPEAVAAVVMAAVDGLLVCHLVDADFDLDEAFVALETLLVSLIERQAARA